MRSYARNIFTLAKKTTLLADVSASEEVDCSMTPSIRTSRRRRSYLLFKILMHGVRLCEVKMPFVTHPNELSATHLLL